MLNRRMRRALERADKKTHKLQPQTCVLWVPAAGGYVESFAVDAFRLVDHVELAQHYCEGHASGVALRFRELFGVHAEVRVYRVGLHRQERRGGISDQLATVLQ